MVYYCQSSELYHHGVLGMKWGVRRYTSTYRKLRDSAKATYMKNHPGADPSKVKFSKEARDELKRQTKKNVYDEDISNLNAAKTSSEFIGKGFSKAKEMNDKKAKAESTAVKKKTVSAMSDEELQAKVRRMNLEEQYMRLAPDQVSKGRKTISDVLGTIGTVAATAASVAGVALTVRQLIEKKSD